MSVWGIPQFRMHINADLDNTIWLLKILESSIGKMLIKSTFDFFNNQNKESTQAAVIFFKTHTQYIFEYYICIFVLSFVLAYHFLLSTLRSEYDFRCSDFAENNRLNSLWDIHKVHTEQLKTYKDNMIDPKLLCCYHLYCLFLHHLIYYQFLLFKLWVNTSNLYLPELPLWW